MVAVAIIMIGLTAVISIGLTAMSNANSSKARLKATSYAESVLEKFRVERDLNGIARFLTVAPTYGAAAVIDGINYQPTVSVYYINSTSAVVETTVCWIYRNPTNPEKVKASVYLPNGSTRFATWSGPYSRPAWYP